MQSKFHLVFVYAPTLHRIFCILRLLFLPDRFFNVPALTADKDRPRDPGAVVGQYPYTYAGAVGSHP